MIETFMNDSMRPPVTTQSSIINAVCESAASLFSRPSLEAATKWKGDYLGVSRTPALGSILLSHTASTRLSTRRKHNER